MELTSQPILMYHSEHQQTTCEKEIQIKELIYNINNESCTFKNAVPDMHPTDFC